MKKSLLTLVLFLTLFCLIGADYSNADPKGPIKKGLSATDEITMIQQKIILLEKEYNSAYFDDTMNREGDLREKIIAYHKSWVMFKDMAFVLADMRLSVLSADTAVWNYRYKLGIWQTRIDDYNFLLKEEDAH